jgi:regulator of protease activity HflC (stomatin/prohibitin superfamily)
MSISSILGFISLAGWVMLLAGAGIAISNVAQNRPARGGVTLAILGLVIGVGFFIFSAGVVVVGPTQTAVVFQVIGGDPEQGSLWPEPLRPGVHIIVPIVNEPIIYSTEVRSYTMARVADEGTIRRADPVEGRTSDGQQVDIDVSVLYSIDPTVANTLHRRWQNRYENDFVRPTVRSAVRERIAFYSVNDLYGGTALQIGIGAGDVGRSRLPEVQRELFTELEPVFRENGLLLQELLIREINFSPEFIRAVEQRQVAQQQAEQARQEAARARTIAEGQANAVREAARGDAEAIRVRASAEAEALRLINEQLAQNPQLIYWRYIERLGDNISLILLPSNSPFLFNFQDFEDMARLSALASGGSQEPTPTPEPSGQ